MASFSFARRLNYYRRILSAYAGRGHSHLTFWHDMPEMNPNCSRAGLGEYYLKLSQKADYPGPLDANGIPLLHYRGTLGLQYNPIAIAQYGLGNYNVYARTRDPIRWANACKSADWLISHLSLNDSGVPVWMHHFDWDYRDTLRAPWYSALAQGQGISLLVRVHKETGEARYLDCARLAMAAFCLDTKHGGVAWNDREGNLWFEEYIVFPPTHILNGFISAALGIYDLFLATGHRPCHVIFARALDTLVHSLSSFDLGYWSLYEQSGTRLPMLASPYYHALHIEQLRILHTISGERCFDEVAGRWELYRQSRMKRNRALAYKALFKLCYY